MNERHILVLFILIALGLFYFLFSLPKSSPEQASVIKEEKTECENGQRQSCIFLNGCDGQKICVDGRWRGCDADIICKPGSKAPCIENACIVGYRICNECGTGFGSCNYTN